MTGSTSPILRRLRMRLSYDGTRYKGMQFLPGVPTVQGEVEKALSTILQEAVRIEPASRTDAGVHALGQTAHFDTASALPATRLLYALNQLLPPDVRILSLRPAPPDFHARFSALGKEYRYFIHNARVLPPFLRFYRHHDYAPMDLPAMRRAARAMEGRHDFAAFTTNPGYDQGDTVRTLRRVGLLRQGHDIVIRIQGDGFLYKMARSLAGWLIRVGRGRFHPDETAGMLAGRLRHPEVLTAPACGLFLWRVDYPTRSLSSTPLRG